MSYGKKIEYRIIPRESFPVIRGCSGCGRKTHFINTKKFRVNANGNKIDVWLIYQCETCKHTLNLAIYERQKVSAISEKEYRRFLGNEEQLAEVYGRNIQLFRSNKAEIDFERLEYEFVALQEGAMDGEFGEGTEFIVYNPYGLKIRPEKQIAGILGLSRSQVKKLTEKGEITLEKSSSQMFSFRFNGNSDKHKETQI
ncbi:MAG: DUF1062 domain-containing protein [Lachnospiraceae bacterium]|nr:DUF1062 domain-containing protein [Lachnospiraceae bacterium]